MGTIKLLTKFDVLIAKILKNINIKHLKFKNQFLCIMFFFLFFSFFFVKNLNYFIIKKYTVGVLMEIVISIEFYSFFAYSH